MGQAGIKLQAGPARSRLQRCPLLPRAANAERQRGTAQQTGSIASRSRYETPEPHPPRRNRSRTRAPRDRLRARVARLRGAASTRRALERTADLALARWGLLRLLARRDGRRVAIGDRT